MKKLTLDLDALNVKSFDTEAGPSAAVQDAAMITNNTGFCCTYTCP